MTDFNSNLGMRPGAEPGTLELEPRAEHLVAPDTVHFAVLTTMAEVSAAGAVGGPVVPAQVSVNLMSRARAELLVARGRVLKAGRTLAVAEGEVLQGDRTVAKATVTFARLGG